VMRIKGGITTWCVALLLLGVVVEGGARLAFTHRSKLIALLPTRLFLNEYQEWDPINPTSWRLKPGFVATFGQVSTTSRGGKYRPDDIFIRINSDGFRGPEIDRTGPHPRIITIGDSSTFGTIEQFSYPRVLEDELKKRGHKNVEVINAGVEGYAPRDVLYQVDRYAALRPSIATIYIGWGSLYNDARVLDSRFGWVRLDSIRLLARATSYAIALVNPNGVQRAQEESRRSIRAELGATEVSRLDRFVPTFMPEIEELVRVLRSRQTTVVLITLPGLYTLDSPPTEQALRIGDLPPFIRNPYVLAKITERYNEEVRGLARREGLHVVDLDAWSRSVLVPRERHFFNAVHLTEEAQELAGRYMGEVLEPVLRALNSRRED
jgi:hypothetical protein